MSLLKVDNVVHWSIPVNDLEESERFYQDVLGFEYRGRLGNSRMACFTVGAHSILLCQRNDPVVRTPQQDNRLHHSFEVSPEMFDTACKLFHARGIRIAEPIVYRGQGFFRAATCSSCAIRPGSPGCRRPRTKRSSGRER